MPESGATIEQEITQLEKQLAEKKAALGREGGPPATSEVEPTEKEMLHSIVGERFQQQMPQYTPTPAKPQTDDITQSSVLPELKDKIQELINLVFNKSLDEGIKEVSNSNNPALIDAFHDVLVDELYNVLVERKKLEEVK
ncbi:MAG: hypothetical protein HY505_01385 [Candidatus Yanofskybacteria bacterium]|nr:hypothetical protein [Candidatus Yanofskybacteria bacterium]